MAAPPELRVLCRRLEATPVDDLPRICPLLVSHVLRCGTALSVPQDAKAKDKLSETSMLVHKLRTRINTLLAGKNPSGRFAAVCLIKAVVDVGGWECLRAAESWLRNMIGVLQKPDPLATKELCIVALTKIYMLLQSFPTLIREMATPTLPSYVSACLQLIKPPASGKPLKVPAAFVDTVACSLSKLVVLYPTTLRPSAGDMKAALRAYIAPTWSDNFVVPESLRESCRRLLVLLSYTAAKNGSSEEWAKGFRSTVQHCHATVDQIFRAVIESWESATGYRSQAARSGADPSGGGDTAEEYPPWTGVQAGAERLIGLLEFLAEYFNNPTKTPVTVPLGELLDLASRITLVTAPSGPEDSVQTNPAIGRDEKAELWSVLPDIHIAVLRLHQALIRRLRENVVPLATDILDQMVRVSSASRHIRTMRETAYVLTDQLLSLCGPALPKLTVDSLAPLIQSTCCDILLSTGHLEPPNPAQQQQAPPNGTTTTTTTKTNQKPNANTTASANADAYLTTTSTNSSASSLSPTPLISATHTKAATSLLPLFLSHLPQSHLAPDLRALLDRTAILSHSRDAMLASCLHPYKDSRGRYYPSILPFVVRRFPQDQTVEVLRSNLVRGPGGGRGGVGGEMRDEDVRVLVGGQQQQQEEEDGGTGQEGKGKKAGGVGGGWAEEKMDLDDDGSGPASMAPESVNAFAAIVSSTTTATATAGARERQDELGRPASPLKRKSEQFESDVGKPPKRVDTGKEAAAKVQMAVMPKAQPVQEKRDEESGDESDSDESVQIDMTLDDDDEEEEGDEE
ncbi:hypothetical protein N657DRAFT_572649 [Parathielavia appendiculata]|uniref:Pre-rRNA-processing protein RIX1 n=1 Tax=Parathielavia appendiculata TaxID=2587402 RepID=A0AAN6Z3I8_9PEZI|nr:hypothetical protein N657DRAFT_572649 [Parathielavia appendiculata]